jgi:MSHA biogenesis protein MshK
MGVMAAADPTAPLGWQQPAQQSSKPVKEKRVRLPTVQSIVCSDNSDCHAVLNNRVVSGGDKVSGYRITEITPQGVRVTRAGREWTLSLFSLSIKQ